MPIKNRRLAFFIFSLIVIGPNPAAFAQTHLSMKAAIRMGIDNYGTVKAKQQYAAAAKDEVIRAKRDYLPNLNFQAQVDYGTARIRSSIFKNLVINNLCDPFLPGSPTGPSDKKHPKCNLYEGHKWIFLRRIPTVFLFP